MTAGPYTPTDLRVDALLGFAPTSQLPRLRRARARARASARAGREQLARHQPQPLAATAGGELQVAVGGRALVGDPDLLILDEPATHLDADGVAQLLAGLDRLRPEATILVVTHDERLAEWAQRRLVVEHGRVLAGAPAG